MVSQGWSMKMRALRAVSVFLMLLMAVGCAHRRDIRAGDEYMEAGAYRAALGHYRAAQERRPKSEPIREKVDAAEQRVLEETLRDVNDAISEGDIEGAIYEAADVARIIEDPDRLDELEAVIEMEVIREAEFLFEDQEFAAALLLIDAHIVAFGEPLEPVAAIQNEISTFWEGELRSQARRYFEEDRFGGAALYYIKADFIGEIADPSAERESRGLEAIQRVQRDDGWGVHVGSNVHDDSLQRVVDRVFEFQFPEAIVDARQEEPFGMEAHIRLTITDPVFEDWEERETRSEEYQSGTRAVSNPAYEREQRNLSQAEDRVRTAERDVNNARRDLRSAERDLAQRRREGRSTSIQESRVDSAYSTLERHERTLDSRRSEVDRSRSNLRQIDPTIEEPVYSTHYYEVTLQKGRMTTDVRLEIVAPSREFEYVHEYQVNEVMQSERHTAQPVIDLPGRDELAPSYRQMRRNLDVVLGNGVAEFLLRAFGRYRHHWVAQAAELPADDKLDRLARFVVLDPEDRDMSYERELRDMAGFYEGVEFLLRATP